VSMTHGSLHMICGPMFSGKTTLLLAGVTHAREVGVQVAVFKPLADARYSADEVVSHRGLRTDAIMLERAENVHQRAGGAAHVALDEAQFWGPELVSSVQTLIHSGVKVDVACLDVDSRGIPFEPVATLLALADRVTKTTCPCTLCGGPARISWRLASSHARILVGGGELYQPLCRNCCRMCVNRETD